MDLHNSKRMLLMEYALGLLNPTDHENVKRHIAECEICKHKLENTLLRKLAENPKRAEQFLRQHLESLKARKENCARVVCLLSGYRDNSLIRADEAFVTTHLKGCRECLDKYHLLVEQKEEAEVAKEDAEAALEKRKKPAISIKVDEIHDFLKKWLPQTGKHYKIEKGVAAPRAYEFSKRGIDFKIKPSELGTLMVHMKSERYDVSDTTVSLGIQKEIGGYDEIFSRKISKKGVAKLGKTSDLPKARGTDRYSLKVSGKKKGVK